MTRAAAAADPAVAAEVAAGLSLARKELPPKYFYDERGSELFEEITRLPEYYPTRAERELLARWMGPWMAELRPRTLVELGAGSAEKTRRVLDAMAAAGRAEAYLPVDVSAEFLARTARRIDGAYPGIRVVPIVADITAEFALPVGHPAPTLHAFLGSTIGNFTPGQAALLLRRIRARMEPGDRFLLGVDLRKDPAVIEAAYNDAAGVTAEFNRNMLRVVNALAGADFDPDAFAHRAFYDPALHRIEMHLVALRPQRVSVPGAGTFAFAEGETLRTEISAKHDRDSVEALFAAAGLAVDRWETHARHGYALALGAPA